MGKLKNIILLVVILILSYFTTEYFANIYWIFSPQNDHSLIGLSQNDLKTLTGGPFAYIFFTVILFQIFGSSNKNKWTGWLLAPALLFFGSGDLKHIYLPIILGLVAFALAKLVNFIVSKLHHPNPPMVVK